MLFCTHNPQHLTCTFCYTFCSATLSKMPRHHLLFCSPDLTLLILCKTLRYNELPLAPAFAPCSYDEIRQMYGVGYDYAARLHANGCFDNFDLAEVLLEVRDYGKVLQGLAALLLVLHLFDTRAAKSRCVACLFGARIGCCRRLTLIVDVTSLHILEGPLVLVHSISCLFCNGFAFSPGIVHAQCERLDNPIYRKHVHLSWSSFNQKQCPCISPFPFLTKLDCLKLRVHAYRGLSEQSCMPLTHLLHSIRISHYLLTITHLST